MNCHCELGSGGSEEPHVQRSKQDTSERLSAAGGGGGGGDTPILPVWVQSGSFTALKYPETISVTTQYSLNEYTHSNHGTSLPVQRYTSTPGLSTSHNPNISLDHTFCFDYGTHLPWHVLWQLYAMSQHLFPSRVALIFGRDFALLTGESNHSFSLFQHIPKTFNGVKSQDSVVCGVVSCVKMTPRAPWHWCVLMLHSFTTRARWILALSSWNMPEPSGKKKINDGITWSFSTFRNSQFNSFYLYSAFHSRLSQRRFTVFKLYWYWLIVPRHDQLKQP